MEPRQSITPKKRKNEVLVDTDCGYSDWPAFIVISSKNKENKATKIDPFALKKTIQGSAGTVKQVKKLRSGDILVECSRKQQSINLLQLTKIDNVPVSASPHNSLNSSKGVIRDRDQDLADFGEEYICSELKSQGVTNVKRFTMKKGDNIIKLNTYLITFNKPSVPESIFIGPYSVRVDLYIPNPTRCFTCQKFGHGKGQCRNRLVCFRCAEEGHEGFDCRKSIKCSNCSGDHMASSKECPFFIKEKQIVTLKVKNNISYQEARRMISTQITPLPVSFANVAKKVFTSVGTQTSLSWPHGDDKPHTNTTVPKPSTSRSVSSTQTQTIKTDAQPAKPKSITEPKPKQTDQLSSNKNQTKSSGPAERPSRATNNSKSSGPAERPSRAAHNSKPSGPAERPSKATRDPIQTFNKFESLEDNVPSPADAMDTTPAPAPGRSQSQSPGRRRHRSWNKDKSSIRLPP